MRPSGLKHKVRAKCRNYVHLQLINGAAVEFAPLRDSSLSKNSSPGVRGRAVTSSFSTAGAPPTACRLFLLSEGSRRRGATGNHRARGRRALAAPHRRGPRGWICGAVRSLRSRPFWSAITGAVTAAIVETHLSALTRTRSNAREGRTRGTHRAHHGRDRLLNYDRFIGAFG